MDELYLNLTADKLYNFEVLPDVPLCCKIAVKGFRSPINFDFIYEKTKEVLERDLFVYASLNDELSDSKY